MCRKRNGKQAIQLQFAVKYITLKIHTAVIQRQRSLRFAFVSNNFKVFDTKCAGEFPTLEIKMLVISTATEPHKQNFRH